MRSPPALQKSRLFIRRQIGMLYIFITHYYAASRHESGQMNIMLVHRWPVGPRCHSSFLTPSSSSLPKAWCCYCASSQTFSILHTENLRGQNHANSSSCFHKNFLFMQPLKAWHSAVLSVDEAVSERCVLFFKLLFWDAPWHCYSFRYVSDKLCIAADGIIGYEVTCIVGLPNKLATCLESLWLLLISNIVS